jgi:CBS-domain-containing membrane protein
VKASTLAAQPQLPARLSATGAQRVADAMITRPTTHGIGSSVSDIARFLADDHVHLALIVTPDGLLVTTIDRADLAAVARPAGQTAAASGRLAGRTVSPSDNLDTVTAWMTQTAQRRAAVVDDSGRLLGLLCMKKTGTGFCSDQDIRQRRGAGPDRLP